MIKIFYNEDNYDDNKLIDNYFFFEYYLNHKFGKINEYKIYKTLNSINIKKL